MSACERIRVVLVRPRDAGNIGAVARAMKNMELARLVLVDPPALDLRRAATLAVHAQDVLDTARTVPTLGDALDGCGLAVATSGRPTASRAGALPPRALAPVIVAAAATNDVALVFGPEDHGLALAELALCQREITIPTSPAYGSLNLAQAVLVCAYEIFLVASGAGDAGAVRALAPSARREVMFAKLEEALRAIGYLHRDNAVHMMRRLRRLLGRADLDDEEVQILLGLARQIAWAGTRGPRIDP